MSIGLWQTLRCTNADLVMAFLTDIGFTEQAVYRSETDPTIVEHAQFVWAHGGGVMLGTHREGTDWSLTPGTAGTYLVTPDPDAVYERAITAGAESIRPPVDEDYGGRGAAVRDGEGNLWSFGSYDPV